LRPRYLAAVACTLLAAACDSGSAPALSAGNVRLYAPLPGSDVGVGYLTLRNGSDEDLTIAGVRSPQFHRVEIHETEISDGVSRMRRLPILRLPARGALDLKPGGRHLMLIGPRDDVTPGASVAIVFESAAIGDVITERNVDQIKAPIILEAANAPVQPAADRTLYDRGVMILPDVLANAGGVTVSYFEWVMNRQHYQWGLNRVRQELDYILTQAFEEVWQEAQQRNCSLRTAAYIIALRRVYRATQLRGIG